MRKNCLVLLMLAASIIVCSASAEENNPVTTERLLEGTDNTNGWTMYGGNYGNWRYSPLEDINKKNVDELTPAWMFQTGIVGQLSGSPIVVDGVMYMSAPYNNLWALDAKTGGVIWHFEHEMPSDLILCCGPSNRGVAIKGDLLFMATLDAKILAIDRATGEVRWTTTMEDYKTGYSATSAPLIVGDMVISGIAGGEYGARGFIDAYDTITGRRVWRRYTIPAAGEVGIETWAGDSWKTGGGPSWSTGTYDPQTNLLYWPIGNPSPDWNGDLRLGDNLYTNSVVALEPETGEMKWHFQFTPHDVWDYDATNGLVVADIDVDGETVRALMQPNRNGYVYTLDAATGAFLKGFQYTDRLNWSKGLDTNGRPQVDEKYTPKVGGAEKFICPGNVGGNNGAWTYAWSQSTKLMYVPSVESCGKMVKEHMTFMQGVPFWGGGPGETEGQVGDAYGTVTAVEPTTGAIRWSYKNDYPILAGALATAGGLVFSGDLEGHAFALDDLTGEVLWKFQTGSSIRSQPITWKVDGEQFVAVPSGGGGIIGSIVGAPESVTHGSTVVVFSVPKSKWFWE
ncbi:MAG: PQQ-dependent dehydrogenase, methanol/ethanol family [Proteobacteria bacterium]|nr:PQQ-dependent dehydrogenase, methanol/ethanol family [Pseudomonadota bacterium]